MKAPEENETQYNRRYHLQRALKPVLKIDSHKRTIDMPEGMKLGKTDQKRVDALVNDFGYVLQAALDIKPFELIRLYGSQGIRGNKIAFRKEKFFSLKTGDEIHKIGKGLATPSNSVDNFKAPAQYQGSLFISGRKYYAFEINSAIVKDDLRYFLLYELAGEEIRRVFYKKDGTHEHTNFYKPEFKLAKAARAESKQKKLNL